MGMLVDGKWTSEDVGRTGAKGEFQRRESVFRGRITADGSSGFPAEAGRYHLYVSHACPWAHRTMLLRKLKGLEAAISVSVVDWHLTGDGWHFSDAPGTVPDTVNGARFLREIYLQANPDYTGRVSVPVLWDKRRNTIVNNESREIIRMFDLECDAIAQRRVSYCPPEQRDEVDAMITANFTAINNGVYRAGFARSQEAYEGAVQEVFAGLDRCEGILARRRYLCGDRITEADWCLFTTLLRFDPVYVGHFKCNLRRLVDYPHLWNYVKELYQVPGVAETVDMFHIKHHYYGSHKTVNPVGLVPIGPEVDFTAPHDRAGRRYVA